MDSMRSFALVFLCFCLAVSGTAAALPRTGMTMESMAAATSMDGDCQDVTDVAAMHSVHDGTAPADEMKADCCKSGTCQCASTHCAFVTIPSFSPPRDAPMATTVGAFAGSVYSSPALARLVRPPIS